MCCELHSAQPGAWEKSDTFTQATICQNKFCLFAETVALVLLLHFENTMQMFQPCSLKFGLFHIFNHVYRCQEREIEKYSSWCNYCLWLYFMSLTRSKVQRVSTENSRCHKQLHLVYFFHGFMEDYALWLVSTYFILLNVCILALFTVIYKVFKFLRGH